MSEKWGYYCEQCEVESGSWLNHGEAQLRACYVAWPHVRALQEMEGDFEVALSIWGSYSGDIWAFLQAHEGHPLLLCSEYGDYAPINPQDVTRGFTVRFTVTGAERAQVQATHGLAQLPDGGQVKRLYEAALRDALHKWITGDY